MLYNTTRNNEVRKHFSEIVCLSNAPCGGLYIPCELPSLKKEDFAGMNYAEIAEKIIGIFTEIPKDDIKTIVKNSLQSFTNGVYKTRDINKTKVIELFHGPTLSFKDYPMQFLGNIVEHTLQQRKQKINIVTATSGDTGPAAIHAFANKENVKIVVLHPKDKVTTFQRRQMTTCKAENVLNIAMDGEFDDCQKIVKEITNLQQARTNNISTVNSVNWGRIMMQMVYYIHILINEAEPVNVFVPTGNFGNIFACYFLQKCGFGGVKKMFISNNANDVITKAHKTGEMQNKPTIHTFAPAIDISIPSNFERMLYLESNRNDEMILDLYKKLQSGENIKLDENLWSNFKQHFSASSIESEVIMKTQNNIMKKYGYEIDPHTAVAFAHLKEEKPNGKSIVISTAHPDKFKGQPTSWEDGEVKMHHTIAADEKCTQCADANSVKKAIGEFLGWNL